MKYKEYLQEALGDDVIVTEELYADNYTGESILVVVKYLSGTNYRDSTIVPIQLDIYTNDVPLAKSIFDTFTKSHTNIPFYSELDYVNQIYSTPMIIQNFEAIGTNYTSQIMVSGTLVISSNVSEISEIFIDGEKLETTMRVISYVGNPDNQRVNSENINTTNIKNGMVKFTCTMINKRNPFCTKIRRIRTGALDIDTNFTIKLVYMDGDEENYTMKLDSSVINSENQSLPILSLSFTV